MPMRTIWIAALCLVFLAAAAWWWTGREAAPGVEAPTPAADAAPRAERSPEATGSGEGSSRPPDSATSSDAPRDPVVRFRPRKAADLPGGSRDTSTGDAGPAGPEGTVRMPFSAVPPEHRPAAFEEALEGLPAWLEEELGEEAPAFERLDCSEPPCFVWMDGGKDMEALARVQKELEERMGGKVAGMISTGTGSVGFYMETPVLPDSDYTSGDLGGSIGRRAARARQTGQPGGG